MPVLSTRNSTLPALISLTACATFGVTVPVFGFGISPRGPSTFPSLPTTRIMSGVATTASKSIQPPAIFSTSSSPPTTSAPASSASFCLSGRGNHQHALRLAQAVRQDDRAAHHLIGVLRIDAEANRQRDGLVELGELDLLDERQRFVQRVRPVFDLLSRRRVFLAVFSHIVSSVVLSALRASHSLRCSSKSKFERHQSHTRLALNLHLN